MSLAAPTARSVRELDLDPGVVDRPCRAGAPGRSPSRSAEQIAGRTTVSVERSVTRLLGVDGADDLEVPLPNVLVDHVHDRGGLGRGVAYWLGNAMLQTGRSPQQIAEAVSAGELDLFELRSSPRRARSASASPRSARRGCARSVARFDERRGDARAAGRHADTRCATC